jgi:hypothetical protein
VAEQPQLKRSYAFTILPNEFVKASQLSHEAFRLYAVLCMHAPGGAIDNAEVFPDYERLKSVANIKHNKTVATRMRELETAGWIERRKRFGASTVYVLTIPKASIPSRGDVLDASPSRGALMHGVNHSPSPGEPQSVTPSQTNKNHVTKTKKQEPVARASRGAPPVDAKPVAVPEAEQTTPAQTPAKLNLYGDLFVAVSNVCQLDRALPRNAKQIADTAKYLAARSVTPDRLAAFTAWWCANDWRGRRGDLPRPGQITEMWLQFEQGKTLAPVSTAATPALQRGGPARTFRRDQATADVVRQAEAKAASTSDESDYLWGETDAEAEARHQRMTARATQGVAS